METSDETVAVLVQAITSECTDGFGVSPGNHIRMCWWLWESKEPIREANSHGTQVASILSNMPLGDHKWPLIVIILHTFAGELCLSFLVSIYSPPFHTLSLQGDEQPVSLGSTTFYTKKPSSSYRTRGGLSCGTLQRQARPLCHNGCILASFSQWLSFSNSETHKYRELVCFSTTRYHQTQHSTDCPCERYRYLWGYGNLTKSLYHKFTSCDLGTTISRM